MNRCPITYELIENGRYSKEGLKRLSRTLSNLEDLPYSAKEQRKEAAFRMQKMSIQGVQPKLSAVLNKKKAIFEVVDQFGKFIIKPQIDIYDQVPENEDLSMKLAATVGIETPFHGLMYCKDSSLSYFIKRFDRVGRNKKLAVEDFAQVAGKDRDTKYNFSLEKMVNLIELHCTFPVIEKLKFFRLILFGFLIGNEDMHLKNFSLIRRKNKVEFSPAYDLINTTLVLEKPKEEMALTLNGKRSNFKRSDLIEYLAKECLELPEKVINRALKEFIVVQDRWGNLIHNSFLVPAKQEKYIQIVEQRCQQIGLVVKV